MPASKALTLSFLATGVDGNQPNQTFVVTYTDGSRTTFTQSLSNWHTPQSYHGESVALSTPYKIGPSGGESRGLYDLYGYTIALDGSKTVQSFILPNNPHVIVLSVDLSASQVAGTPTFSNPAGSYAGSVSVVLSDLTPRRADPLHARQQHANLDIAALLELAADHCDDHRQGARHRTRLHEQRRGNRVVCHRASDRDSRH